MDTEAKIIIAFLFNRSGKPGLTEAELYLPLSMELGWFSAKEAKEFVTYAVKQDLLTKKEGVLHPTFQVQSISIPVGFSPSKKTLKHKTGEKKEESIVDIITTQICTQAQKDANDITHELQQLVSEKNISLEVAALYLARRYGLDITSWYDPVEQSFF